MNTEVSLRQPPPVHLPAAGACLLPDWGVLRASGADAASFLQGQLTQDVLQCPADEARLAAWCNAKGRVLASFVLCQDAVSGDVLLLGQRALLPTVLKRLSMFVLRAKVKLSDASDAFTIAGCLGDTIHLIAGVDAPTRAIARFDTQTLIGLWPAVVGAQVTPRALWLAPAGTPAPGPTLELADWQRAEVLSGVAHITPPLVEALVPQMLNYESVDGVNFKKGCYPGQEVVARSQFRGTLKRRTFVASTAAEAAPGQPVFGRDADQPCGLVVQAAPLDGGGSVLLASLQLSHADGPLHLATPDGPALTLHPLPYALREDL